MTQSNRTSKRGYRAEVRPNPIHTPRPQIINLNRYDK